MLRVLCYRCVPLIVLLLGAMPQSNDRTRFRDLKSEYDELDCVVLGVSADGEASHKDFIADLGLNFSLLADTNKWALDEARGEWCSLAVFPSAFDHEARIRLETENHPNPRKCSCRETSKNGLVLFSFLLHVSATTEVNISHASWFAGP